MNSGDHVSSQLTQVRRLLQRLAEPHRAVHFITDDVETHVAMLDPKLSVLDPAPFHGLSTTHPDQTTSHPPVRRSPPPTSTDSGPPAEPRRRIESTRHVAPSVRSLRVGERLSASPASDAPRASEAIRPIQRFTKPGVLPAVSSPASPRENVLEVNASAGYAAAATHESMPKPVTSHAEQPEQVDLDALVRRVLRTRRGRQSARHSARGAERGESPAAVSSVPADAARIAPELEVTKPALVQRLGLPVSPLSTRSANIALQASRHDQQTVSEKSDSFSPLIPARTPPAMTPGSSPVRGGHTAFFFDPFEPREPVDIGEHALTDRIDQALREQARRQGVDLT